MARDTPASSSAALSAVGFLAVFVVVIIAGPTLASTKAFTLLGGLLSSILFFFALTFICNVEEIVLPGRQPKWPEVFLALFVACSIAGLIHRVCITVCALCSFGQVYLMVGYLSRQDAAVAAAKSQIGKKR